MKPEELKIIAEGMGYSARIQIDVVLVMKIETIDSYHNPNSRTVYSFGYNPLTNDTQCMEIMEKLKVSIDSVSDDLPQAHIKHLWCSGKTINEAVCRAALVYFKGDVNE